MEEKHLHNVSSGLKTNYQAALSALEKKSVEYAIMLLKGVIQKEPGFMEARQQLRKIEKEVTNSASVFKKIMNKIKTSPSVAAATALLAAKKPLEAMKKAEDALAIDLSSLQALMLLSQAAEQLGADFIAIEALEIAREYNPKNISVLDKLASAYVMAKKGNLALRVRQEIATMMPDNLEAQQRVREAAAVATMEQGRWENGDDDYRSKLKNQTESVKLEQADRIVRNIDDVGEMIEEYEKQRKSGKDTLEVKRKLADLYQKSEQHDKAIEYFNMVIEAMGATDPLIDRGIEKSNVGKYNIAIREWEEYSKANSEKKEECDANIAELKRQREQYSLEKAVERVNNYPNDLQLRYELACAYWEGGDVENALQQFQMSQKNPQRRLSSFVYLGRCFAEKSQHDMAIEQFTKAIAEMIAMDNNKMEALYYLGLTYQNLGKIDQALDCFKKIYQANVKFRDVAERINNSYPQK